MKLSRTIRANRDRILAAVELGLSNSKLEGLNSKIRLINHRGYGHHSAAALIAMIYLAVAESRSSYPRKDEENLICSALSPEDLNDIGMGQFAKYTYLAF